MQLDLAVGGGLARRPQRPWRVYVLLQIKFGHEAILLP
jgi:hypothetical protein